MTIKLSIITISRNDAVGLKRTIESVRNQQLPESLLLEHIIVDGASEDDSIGVVHEYEKSLASFSSSFLLEWISEPDGGIYQAMNKGIEVALHRRVIDVLHHSNPSADAYENDCFEPHYIQILNAGDSFASASVLCQMYQAILSLEYPQMIYGNMLRVSENGDVLGKSGNVDYSFRQYYCVTLNHNCTWVMANLFLPSQYGLYDETLKICSDWKWFLLAIGLGNVKPEYVDIDVTRFVEGGISERQRSLRLQERRQVLQDIVPPAVRIDYDKYAYFTYQVDRLRCHHLWPIVNLIERILSKLERWHLLRP